MVELYYDKALNKHFFCGDPACNKCKEQVRGSGYYISMTCLKNEPKQLILKNKLFCKACAFERKKLYDVVYWVEIRGVIVVRPAPYGAIPVILRPNYDVKDNKSLQAVLSTWAAEDHRGIKSDTSACQVNDYTRFANKESWKGVKIGASVNDADKDKLLETDEDIDNILLEFKKSEVVKDGEESW